MRGEYTKTFTYDGKRYFVSASTEKDLAVKVAMKRRDLEEGKQKITRTTTVAAWSSEYLETYRRPKCGDKAYSDMESLRRVWIVPHIGALALKDVKPIHCQKLLNLLEGLSTSHIRKLNQLLDSMFETALDNGLLLANPAKRLTMPKGTKGTHHALTETERNALLAVVDGDGRAGKYALWVKLMLFCGLRPSETARVQGQHIDLAGRKLYVDGTKSKAARRWVPIPDSLVADLSEAVITPFKPLLGTERGRPLTATAMRRHWQVITRAMNIAMGCRTFKGAVVPPYRVRESFTPYDLRHTYATELQAAGVPLNVAKELLGHEDVSTTANIYTHGTAETFENAAALINARSKARTGKEEVGLSGG
jgi:integrase